MTSHRIYRIKLKADVQPDAFTSFMLEEAFPAAQKLTRGGTADQLRLFRIDNPDNSSAFFWLLDGDFPGTSPDLTAAEQKLQGFCSEYNVADYTEVGNWLRNT